jgi:tRNA A37 methylthiotransferase MiaB
LAHAQGVRQVTLLGQNVNSYRDTTMFDDQQVASTSSTQRADFKTVYRPRTGGWRFVDLLDRVSSVDPNMRIRFTAAHPKDFPIELLQLIGERANICKQVG